jgi:predicted RND superfamily exporter protein
MPTSAPDGLLVRLLDVARRRAGAVFVAAGIAAAVGAVLVAHVSFDANVFDLLPRTSPPVQSFRTFLQEFGSLDQLYIVFESANAIGEHSDLVDAYVEELRKAPEIASVDVQLLEPGKDWSYLSDRELYLLGRGATAEALTRLRPPALDREIAHARDLLSVPSPDVKAYVQQDPVGLLGLLRGHLGRQQGLAAFDPTQAGYVSPDGRSRLVIVKPAGAPFDTDFCKRLFRRLDEVERTARASVAAADDSGPVTIQAAGAYRVSLEAESLIRTEGIVNTVGSLGLLLVIVFLLFRTPWMMLYGALPLGLAALLALGTTGAIKGSLSPATSGSAGMLFGLGLDGVVLLYMRYLEEQDTGRAPVEACSRMAGTASAVVLAQVTTAATFFALLFIDFPTLRDLGAIVGAGILLACAFTLLLLPALLSRDRSRRRTRALTTRWLGRFVVRASRRIVVVAAVATAVLGVAASRLHVDMGLERLQAQTRGSQLEREVGARFGLPTDMLLALNENDRLEPLRAADARITEALTKREPAMVVSGIGFLLPPPDVQGAVAEQIRKAGASPSETAAAIRAAAERAGFRPDALAPFLERLPRLLDPEARITYDGLIKHGLESIVSRFVVRRDGQYAAVTYLYPQHPVDIEALELTLHGIDPRLRLTGLPAIDHDLSRRFPRQFLKGIALGTIAVAVLIYGVFRSILHTLLALVPTVAGFVWSAGLLALARVELDLFSMFAVVTCIGIAVDYGIYVLHRYANEAGGDVGEVLTRTGAAIMLACLTALVGFGSLLNSSYRPLRVFGTVSAVTLICCLAASLLLLPALLVQMERASGDGFDG